MRQPIWPCIAPSRGLPVEFYNAQMREALEEHNHVRQTLKSDDLSQVLSVAYQPILFFDGDGLEGQWAVEALARWKAPGYAPNPHTFIDIAEKSGSILSLTQCIVEQVNHDLKRLSERGALNYISLNLSPLLLHQPSIFNELLEAIKSSGFAQDGYPKLCLEITESNPLDFNDQLNQQFSSWLIPAGSWPSMISGRGIQVSAILSRSRFQLSNWIAV